MLLLFTVVQGRLDIRDFGAQSEEDYTLQGYDYDNLQAEQKNALALNDALVAANWRTNWEDKEVYIPGNQTYHMMPIRVEELYNVTLTIDGTVKATKR